MKYITYVIIGIMLIASVNALTQEQLETYTDNDIKQYIKENAISNEVYKTSNDYVFGYTIKTIVKVNNEYQIQHKIIEGKLSRDIWTLCRGFYNKEECENILINDLTRSYSVKYKIYMELNQEVKKIANWRDNPTINEDLIMGELI